MKAARTMVVSLATMAAAACGGSSDFAPGDLGIDSEIITSADESVGEANDELSSAVAVGTIVAATSDLNLRSGAGMNYGVRRVIPSGSQATILRRDPTGPWYNIRYQGTDGWSHGLYLRVVQAPAPPQEEPSNDGDRDAAVSRAKAGVGFSYWWGHGKFLAGGVSSSTRGSCTGSCPSCNHSGRYGADCSGYIAKIWQVTGANGALDVDQHPYSTWHFRNESHGWHGINRGNAEKADAFVYNSNGSGHIVLYESGDAWGSLWAYEAKGCSYGIVHNLRQLSSSFRGIARDGY